MHCEFATDRDLLKGPGTARSGGRLSTWLSIDPSEALFSTRGFAPTSAQARLESAGSAFISGYNFGLAADDPVEIGRHISAWARGERGFVAEGTAMAAAIRTALMPWKNRLGPVLKMLSVSYPHLAHVGVGWAVARLPFAAPWLLRQLDPRLLPLAIDGRGFHDGYFRGLRGASRQPAGHWGRIYDQGLGRSLWFACGADPDRLARAVAGEEAARRDDLWAGIGLACAYSGGADTAAFGVLRRRSGASARWLRQGAAFAVSAHDRAGAVPDESALAASELCDVDATLLVRLVDRHFKQAAEGPQPAAYQNWRRRVAEAIDQANAGACQ